MKTIAAFAATSIAIVCSTVHAQIPLSGPQEKMTVHTPESLAKQKAERDGEKTDATPSALPPPALPAPADPSVDSAEGRYLPKWVLRRNGRIMFGEVMKDSAGYLFRSDGARFRMSFNEVEAVQDTKVDIVRYKRNRIASNDLDERLELAKWCLRWAMIDEAKSETKAVLAIDPDYEPAKKLLKNLTANNDPVIAKPDGKAPAGGANLAGDAGGFGDEAIHQFTDRVQLILINKCGKCHCNSRHESQFKLADKSKRITPTVTSKNFKAAELMVDLKNPGRSKLLEMAITPHGGPKVASAGFGGPNDEGFKTLRKWAFTLSRNWHDAFADPEGMPQIAQDDVPLPNRRPAATTAAKKPMVASKMKSAPEKPGFASAAADDAPPERPSLMVAPKRPAKKSQEEGDPLDPNGFNRSEGSESQSAPKSSEPKKTTRKASGSTSSTGDAFKDLYGDVPASWKTGKQ